MVDVVIDDLPGFRRRFRIVPQADRVSCEVEDDFHCMVVVVHHDGETANKIEPKMRRAPWTTCPGAEKQLQETFVNQQLADFPARGGKKANCTHLYDLAMLAASHATDEGVIIYDILVSDPVDGIRYCELRSAGECLMKWAETGFLVSAPKELAGMNLTGDLSPWIGTMSAASQEAARLLRWANMIANGRQIPLENQSDATQMPPNCYTFQPDKAVLAQRVGGIRDFSGGSTEPLSSYELPLQT